MRPPCLPPRPSSPRLLVVGFQPRLGTRWARGGADKGKVTSGSDPGSGVGHQVTGEAPAGCKAPGEGSGDPRSPRSRVSGRDTEL